MIQLHVWSRTIAYLTVFWPEVTGEKFDGFVYELLQGEKAVTENTTSVQTLRPLSSWPAPTISKGPLFSFFFSFILSANQYWGKIQTGKTSWFLLQIKRIATSEIGKWPSTKGLAQRLKDISGLDYKRKKKNSHSKQRHANRLLNSLVFKWQMKVLTRWNFKSPNLVQVNTLAQLHFRVSFKNCCKYH